MSACGAQRTHHHLPQSTHTNPSSLGRQFLKAPHLLALAMNSFSRGPSICQNAAVCVTSVKWLMQNLKQNSSKSWTHTTEIKKQEKAFLIDFDRFTYLQIPPHSLRENIWGLKFYTLPTAGVRETQTTDRERQWYPSLSPFHQHPYSI